MLIGIDPGISGAIAFLNGDALEIIDTPVLKTNGKSSVDSYQLARLIDAAGTIDHAFIEQVGARPGQGVTSMFSFGKTYGTIIGILAANFIPMTFVTPGSWKKTLRVPSDKDAARSRASELMPQHSHLWPLKKHDGRAEAALLAYWGRSTFQLPASS